MQESLRTAIAVHKLCIYKRSPAYIFIYICIYVQLYTILYIIEYIYIYLYIFILYKHIVFLETDTQHQSDDCRRRVLS